ncbi:MAG: hypothetical protein R3C03_11390 [Pirellulaceae bacterium]
MGYRIQLLAQFGGPTNAMQSKILEICPDFETTEFNNPQVFRSTDYCSCLAVSKRSRFCNYFEQLAGQFACVWIVTNDTDDWHLKIQNKNDVLANLHLPLMNVDPDEWCESDGNDVRLSIACELPVELSNQILKMDTKGAWSHYFEYAERTIRESLTASKITFDTGKLSMLFSEVAFTTVSRTVGSQLGFFVNEVLGVGLDLTPADEY